jgi:hypothetical protein
MTLMMYISPRLRKWNCYAKNENLWRTLMLFKIKTGKQHWNSSAVVRPSSRCGGGEGSDSHPRACSSSSTPYTSSTGSSTCSFLTGSSTSESPRVAPPAPRWIPDWFVYLQEYTDRRASPHALPAVSSTHIRLPLRCCTNQSPTAAAPLPR